jgi:hypothetical protein
MGHIRSHGVRRLLIYCTQGLFCHHSAVVDADRWPDDTVLLDLDRKAVCTKCGVIGADVRPNWSERPQPLSLTGRASAPAMKDIDIVSLAADPEDRDQRCSA